MTRRHSIERRRSSLTAVAEEIDVAAADDDDLTADAEADVGGDASDERDDVETAEAAEAGCGSPVADQMFAETMSIICQPIDDDDEIFATPSAPGARASLLVTSCRKSVRVRVCLFS